MATFSSMILIKIVLLIFYLLVQIYFKDLNYFSQSARLIVSQISFENLRVK